MVDGEHYVWLWGRLFEIARLPLVDTVGIGCGACGEAIGINEFTGGFFGTHVFAGTIRKIVGRGGDGELLQASARKEHA